MDALMFDYYLNKKQLKKAIEMYKKFSQMKFLKDYYLLDMGLINLAMGELNKALTFSEQMQDPAIHRYARGYAYPRSFYLKGLIYEAMDNDSLAIENYQALLELWKDADEEIPERRDTIKRLAALKQGS